MIRDAFHQRGELSAVIELRRLFPGVMRLPACCRRGPPKAALIAAGLTLINDGPNAAREWINGFI